MTVYDELLRDTIDLHRHVDLEFSESYLRKREPEWEWLPKAEKLGMRGVLLKSHWYPTAAVVPYIRQLYDGPTMLWSSVALNRIAGGPELWAAESAAAMGARVIFLPTWGSCHDLQSGGGRIMEHLKHVYPTFDPTRIQGPKFLDNHEKLTTRGHELLELCHTKDLTLATGHLSWQEAMAFAQAAHARKYDRLIFTHPILHTPLDALRQAADWGAWIEQPSPPELFRYVWERCMTRASAAMTFAAWRRATRPARWASSSGIVLATPDMEGLMSNVILTRCSRRRLLALLCSSGTAVYVAACTPAAPPASTPAATAATALKPAATTVAASASTPTPATAAQPTLQPKRGGTLRAALAGDLTSIDGQQSLPGVVATVGNAYETLTRYDARLQPQPVLAESWDLSSDGKQIKLNLRKGVQFHDGRELTSDDINYSLLRMRNPQLAAIAGQLASQSAWWTNISMPDKYTIVLGSDVPRPGVFDFLQYFTIVDKNLMESPDAATKANGTGPFTFVEWISGDHVTMQRNPNYWDKTLPYLDSIQTRIFRDTQAMTVTLETGALDEVDAPGLRDLVRLKADQNYQPLVVEASGQFVCMVANTTVAPTDNKQFRQAVNYAINRKRFVDTIFLGIITDFQDLPFPPQAPAYDAGRSKLYTYDLDKAKSLLQASGISNPDVELVYSSTTFGELNQALAQIVQADLGSIGVTVTLRPVEFATQVELASRRTYRGLLLSAGSSAQLAEASSFLTRSRFYSPDPKTSFTGLDNPMYTQLISAAATEPDAAKRRDLYGRIQDIILDESAAMTVSLYPSTALARSNVHGLMYDSRPALTYARAWLA